MHNSKNLALWKDSQHVFPRLLTLLWQNKGSDQWCPFLRVHGVGVAAEADEKLHHLFAVVDAALENKFLLDFSTVSISKIGRKKKLLIRKGSKQGSNYQEWFNRAM